MGPDAVIVTLAVETGFKYMSVAPYDHPAVGPLTLEWATYTPDSDPDQQITVFTAEPGSPDAEALDRLREAAAQAATARP